MSRVIGVVAEYNPFHNGHYYHLQATKEITGAEYCVAVISGNFTQRGDTSIVNKWAKAYMAICGGADLVIELPTVYSISSAENFASGAVKILDNLKVVDAISFGAEANDLATLNNIANVLYEEPKAYTNILSHELKKGISYPAARENALMMYLNDIKRYANTLSSPNNILAIEYLKALKIQKSKLEPIMIRRKKVYYNDNKIVDDFASATAIRKLLQDGEYANLRKVIPRSSYTIIGQESRKGGMVLSLSKYEKEIIYTLRKMTVEEIADLPDVSEGLQFAIKNAANEANNLKDLISNIKSKRYTQTRIQRILLYALLGIDKKLMENSRKVVPYVRVLGFTQKGKSLLSEISRRNPKLNIITSLKKYMDQNQNKNKVLAEMLEKDIFATDVYTLGYIGESKANLDFTNNMIITN
ncbi:MAG: nucleotidyltransferase [Clostridium sp.]|nr:nucleotidyltransferase [Clostridium sp.]